jgi:hypothetical protein
MQQNLRVGSARTWELSARIESLLLETGALDILVSLSKDPKMFMFWRTRLMLPSEQNRLDHRPRPSKISRDAFPS